MEQILAFSTILVPIITGLVQLLKKTFNLPKNFIPLISLAVGIAVGYLSFPFSDFELAIRVWAGGLAGLGAVGLFEIPNQRTGTTKEHKSYY